MNCLSNLFFLNVLFKEAFSCEIYVSLLIYGVGSTGGMILGGENGSTLRDFRFPRRSGRDIRCSGLLCSE